jgi:DNA-binding beta-propeller fold protein YncE
VYSYPELKRVGAIYDYRYPLGLCSDAQGNVYVTEFAYAEITEYAHGGTSPLRTLYDSGSDPRDCSIDSTTGNVAVANYDPGGVVVFPIGSGSPESYSPGLDYPNACAYDGSGNLFVDGSGGGGGFALAELPAGESTFEPIGLNKSIGNAGDVEWDGTYLAVADYDLPSAIYRFAMSGSSGTLVDSISLSGPLYRPEFGNQFAVHGGRVTLPYALKDTENSPGKIGIWAYPAGGALLKKRGHFGASHLFGVTVSIKR